VMLTDADQGYFSTAAQVIPIMAVGLAVEARVFDRLPEPKRELGWWVVYLVIGTVIGLLSIAEVVALSDLGSDSRRSHDKGIVAYGLVAGGVALYFGLMPHLIRSRGPWDRRIAPLRAATAAVPIDRLRRSRSSVRVAA
jgi:hypothetical protein